MRLVELETYYDAQEAQLVLSLIDAYGFPGYLVGAEHLAAAPHLRFALGGSKVLVIDEDLPAIKTLLEDSAATPDLTLPRISCPSCQAVSAKWRPNWLSAIFAIVLVSPFIHQRRHVRCSACGAEAQYTVRDTAWHPLFSAVVIALILVYLFLL